MSICRRGYRGVFWDIFVREKCARVGLGWLDRVMECRDGNKMEIRKV